MSVSPFMLEALNMANKAMRITSPNPRVGCVIVNAHGQILGQGHTQAVPLLMSLSSPALTMAAPPPAAMRSFMPKLAKWWPH